MAGTMQLASYQNPDFERGAGRLKELGWLCLSSFFVIHSVMPWYRLRRFLLRRFGAQIGRNVIVKPGAKITLPWRLRVGDHSWIGEEAWLLNLAPITIGSNVCISQRAFLCTGSHDWSKETFDLITKPIVVEDDVWICANVFVGPGVTVGHNSVATAGSVVTRDLPPDMICSGNPCVPEKRRVCRPRDAAEPDKGA